jgi:hypothetical protein
MYLRRVYRPAIWLNCRAKRGGSPEHGGSPEPMGCVTRNNSVTDLPGVTACAWIRHIEVRQGAVRAASQLRSRNVPT